MPVVFFIEDAEGSSSDRYSKDLIIIFPTGNNYCQLGRDGRYPGNDQTNNILCAVANIHLDGKIRFRTIGMISRNTYNAKLSRRTKINVEIK